MSHGTNHARDRAAERYGLQLGAGEMQSLCDQVGGGRAVLLSRQSDGRLVYLAQHDGQALKLVFDPGTATIVTFLPPAAKNRRAGRTGPTPKDNTADNRFARRRRAHAS